jgi:hypothetical protein
MLATLASMRTSSIALLLVLLLGGGCARFVGSFGGSKRAGDAGRSDADGGGISSDGAPVLDGGGTNTDGGVPSDGAQQPDLSTMPLQPLCAAPGIPQEPRPLPSVMSQHARASVTTVPFCLDQTPPLGQGDQACRNALGADYRWHSGAQDSLLVYNASQELATFAKGQTVHLIGRPDNGGGFWQSVVAECQRIQGEACRLKPAFGTSCLPAQGVASALWCSKDVQGATTISGGVDPGGVTASTRGLSVAGAYDSRAPGYAIVYMTDRANSAPQLRFAIIDPYAKGLSNDRVIATVAAETAHPRLARGETADGQSRFFVLWQQGDQRSAVLLDRKGRLLVGPFDPIGLSGTQSANQYAVSYDESRRQFLVVGVGVTSQAKAALYGRFYGVAGATAGPAFSVSNTAPELLRTRRMMHAAYSPKDDVHMVVSGRDVFVITGDGKSRKHRALAIAGELHGLAANTDRGGSWR